MPGLGFQGEGSLLSRTGKQCKARAAETPQVAFRLADKAGNQASAWAIALISAKTWVRARSLRIFQ